MVLLAINQQKTRPENADGIPWKCGRQQLGDDKTHNVEYVRGCNQWTMVTMDVSVCNLKRGPDEPTFFHGHVAKCSWFPEWNLRDFRQTHNGILEDMAGRSWVSFHPGITVPKSAKCSTSIGQRRKNSGFMVQTSYMIVGYESYKLCVFC